MRSARYFALVVLLCGASSGLAQTPTPTPTNSPANPAPAPTVIAATVNGQNIPELAVYRALQLVPLEQRAVKRLDLINYLVDNALIDQYLDQLKIVATDKELDAAVQEMKDEAKKKNIKWDELLQTMHLAEAELRVHMTCTLRWDKFVAQYAPEAVVKDFFDKNRNFFDGSQVRARHILLTLPPGNPQGGEQVKAQLLGVKKQIEDRVAQELAKLPPGTDNLGREKARMKALDEAFAEAARDKSACPTKKDGGDLGYFFRAGNVAEPFARAAFGLEPYKLSDVVQTEFGSHLMVVLDHKTGREVKYEILHTVAREVYAERLRETILSQARPKARITIHPQGK